MAVATQQGDVHHGRSRGMIGGRQDVVFAVAIGAARRQRITACRRGPVETGLLRQGFGFVANAAIDQFEIAARGVPGSARIHVAVAVYARLAGVNRIVVDGHVHVSRDILVATSSREFRIVVALQAAVVVLGRGARCGEKE